MQKEPSLTVITTPADGNAVQVVVDNFNQPVALSACGSSQNQVQAPVSTLVSTSTQSCAQNTLLDGIVEDLRDNHSTQNFTSGDHASGITDNSSFDNQIDLKPYLEAELRPIFSYSDLHGGELNRILEISLVNSRRNSIQVELQQNEHPTDNLQNQEAQQSNIIQAPNQVQALVPVQQNLQPADNNDSDDDDCLMIGDDVPLPLHATAQNLVKYQNDEISGNIPFMNTVSFHHSFNVSGSSR